ncbi:MAG TPA: hypothetical protein VNO79_06265 [Actinomycetota bacterium]|nr:hypothetical protein [Actinomycetota bacterium]
MAIKGKGRTRSKQVARAPRPVPVRVKPPLLLRRPVQVAGAFLAGMGLVAAVVWAANGIRAERAAAAAAARDRTREAVLREYQARIQAILAPIGQPRAPVGFDVLPAFSSELARLADGKAAPSEVAGTAREAAAAAQRAAGQLQAMKLDDLLRDKGFSLAGVNYVLNSRRRMAQGLELYARAARAVARAARLPAEGADGLVALASEVADLADQVFQDGWQDYQQALTSAGIFPDIQPPGPGDLGGG